MGKFRAGRMIVHAVGDVHMANTAHKTFKPKLAKPMSTTSTPSVNTAGVYDANAAARSRLNQAAPSIRTGKYVYPGSEGIPKRK